MKKMAYSSLVFIVMALCWSKQASAFIVSMTDCNSFASEAVYRFKFSSLELNPDYSVTVSSFVMSPDFRIRLVEDPREANLLLVDNFDDAEMSICNSPLAMDSLTIQVSSFAINPDIHIEMSSHIQNPDYTLFVLSDEITEEEAAAFFMVLFANN